MHVKMTHKIALVGTLAVGVAVIGLLYAQLNEKETRPRIASSSTRSSASAKDSPGPGMKALGMDEASRRKMHKEWVKNQDVFSATVDTSQALAFKLKSPKSQALGGPTGIYVEKIDNKNDRVATIFYGDPEAGIEGICVSANKRSDTIDFQAWAGEQEKNKKEGILKADNTPFLVEVSGNDGWAWGPGYNIVNESKEPKYGFVQWQEDNGVVYTVNGTRGPNGTSVKELLEIARSVSE